MKNTDRREFIKLVTATAGAAISGQLVSQPPHLDPDIVDATCSTDERELADLHPHELRQDDKLVG